MAAKASTLPVSIFLFFLLLASGGIFEAANAQRTWCIPKPSSDQPTLLANIDFACSHVDCSIFQKSGPCFHPDNLMNHASIAMNLYYQAMGRNWWNCDFNKSGLIVLSDPSNIRHQSTRTLNVLLSYKH
ncbi:hypothetical protein SAY86_024252 [Trapa natans]|uniref:X8 domain-containing protein n=1 Tax=Trapa natans TaxID=22666 RepID=A0AAN7RDB0_TRANT|nr:hypothetical protein SAY86_024252 [Trapa natans]